MKQPKVEKINLPYASAAASYFGDQGATQGSSFLGRMFANSAKSLAGQPTSDQTAKQPNLFGKGV
jgi:hypothetical protein